MTEPTASDDPGEPLGDEPSDEMEEALLRLLTQGDSEPVIVFRALAARLRVVRTDLRNAIEALDASNRRGLRDRIVAAVVGTALIVIVILLWRNTEADQARAREVAEQLCETANADREQRREGLVFHAEQRERIVDANRDTLLAAAAQQRGGPPTPEQQVGIDAFNAGIDALIAEDRAATEALLAEIVDLPCERLTEEE